MAFELVWEHTGKRGTKFKALKAWEKVGKPDLPAIEAPWADYLLSDRPRAGFIKDLSTWLNERGHQQEWEPAKPRVASGGRAANNVAVAEEFMRERGIR